LNAGAIKKDIWWVKSFASCSGFILVVFVFLNLNACVNAPAGSYLRKELAGLGPLPLDPSNPYVAPNMLLDQEVKAHDVVRGFVRFRGTPDLIEARQSYFRPFRLYFFYLDKGEGYLLEEIESDWLVKGPEKIPTDVKVSLGEVKQLAKPAPLVSGVPEKVAEAVAPHTAKPEPEKRPLPQAAPSPKKRLVEKLPDAKLTEETAATDVLHHVRYKGETLRTIAAWYTGNPDNAERIARINAIEDANVLSMDAVVRIPRYLLIRTKPMPEDFRQGEALEQEVKE
jgi:hypothetical protein